MAKTPPSRDPAGNTPPQPYGSALDLPSMQELLTNLRGMKTLTRFIARDQHAVVKELERSPDSAVSYPVDSPIPSGTLFGLPPEWPGPENPLPGS